MTTRIELLALFKLNTGKVLMTPKQEPSMCESIGYQYPRTRKYQLRYKE